MYMTKQIDGLSAKRGTLIEWTWLTKNEPTPDNAVQIQRTAGYHAAGYGFYRFKTTKTATGFMTTWACDISCD